MFDSVRLNEALTRLCLMFLLYSSKNQMRTDALTRPAAHIVISAFFPICPIRLPTSLISPTNLSVSLSCYPVSLSWHISLD